MFCAPKNTFLYFRTLFLLVPLRKHVMILLVPLRSKHVMFLLVPLRSKHVSSCTLSKPSSSCKLCKHVTFLLVAWGNMKDWCIQNSGTDERERRERERERDVELPELRYGHILQSTHWTGIHSGLHQIQERTQSWCTSLLWYPVFPSACHHTAATNNTNNDNVQAKGHLVHNPAAFLIWIFSSTWDHASRRSETMVLAERGRNWIHIIFCTLLV